MNNKLKTIILEDDMVSRMILENYCQNHPSIDLVKDFDDIASAKEFLAKETADLVLLDIQLKNSSGFDLLQHLPPSTQVIVTTGSKKSIEEANKLGLDNCLLKPISLESFLFSIKKLESASSELI
jgi:two-component system CitB family response regulator/CitB family two-component system response regulator MalR